MGRHVLDTQRRRLHLGVLAALSTILLCLAPNIAAANAQTSVETLAYAGFSDVNEDEWYVTSGVLDYAVEHGLFSGYGDAENHFGPHDDVTRGQVAVILHRIAGSPNAEAPNFDDVDYSLWYGNAIEWARSTGVINGYDGTNLFDPDAKVSREQLAVMLSNYADKIAGLQVDSDCKALDSIAESNLVSSWAREQMGWAVDNGILSGIVSGDSAFVRPQGTAERCHAVKMMSVFHRDVLGLGDSNPDGPNDSDEDLPTGNGVEYTAEVKDGGQYLSFSNDGTSATMSKDKAAGLKPGDIVLFEQTLEYPGGAAIKVDKLVDNGGTISVAGTKPTLREIYTEYDVEETAYVEPENFEPAPGVRVLDDNSIRTLSDGEYYAKGIPIDLASIDLGDQASLTGSLIIKPGVIFDLNIFDEMRLGVIGSAKLNGTLDIDALPSKYKHIELGQATIFGIHGWGAAVVFYLNLDLNGNITITTEVDYEASINTRKGPIGEIAPKGTTVKAEVNAEIALEADAAFQLGNWSLGETGLETGLHGSASSIDRPNSTLVCTDFSSYMFLNFVWDLFEGVDLDAVYLDGDKGLIDETNSPLKMKVHFENGEKVSKCTWDSSEGDDNDDDAGDSGSGSGTNDPSYDGVPLEDEGYGFEPKWTTGENGRAEIAEPFYVDAGNKIVIRVPKDSNARGMFGIDNGTSLIRRTNTFDSGESYSYISQGSIMYPWNSGDYSTLTIEVLVGRMKVWSLRGWKGTQGVVPEVQILHCEQFDYPIHFESNTIELKVGQTYQLKSTQTVTSIYDAIGAEYEGSNDWAYRSSDRDIAWVDGNGLITAESPGTVTINVCYGAEPLTTRAGFNRQCKVIVTE